MDTLNNMTIGQLAGNTTLIVVVLSAFVEIAPIKVNPLSALLRWMGSKINQPLMERLDGQEKRIEAVFEAIDENEIDRIRWEILAFANSCRYGQKHTEDEFDHIIELNAKYHKVITKRNMTNGKLDLEYDYIESIYRNCQEKNSFL